MPANPESDRELLIRIDERTQRLHDAVLAKDGLVTRVDSLESSRDRGRGVLTVIGILWAGLEAWIHLRSR